MKGRRVVIGIVGVVAVASLVSAGAPKKHAARVSVKGQVQKSRDSSKEENANSSTKVKSETQFYDLQITVANTIKKSGTFDLEWYFFKRNLDAEGDKGDPVLCEKNKVTLEIGGMKRVLHKLQSKELTWKETKKDKSSSGKSSKNSSSSNSKIYSGSVYEGYVILVKNNGDIVAKYSDEKKLLSTEWLGRLEMPVQSGSASAQKTKKKK